MALASGKASVPHAETLTRTVYCDNDAEWIVS